MNAFKLVSVVIVAGLMALACMLFADEKEPPGEKVPAESDHRGGNLVVNGSFERRTSGDPSADIETLKLGSDSLDGWQVIDHPPLEGQKQSAELPDQAVDVHVVDWIGPQRWKAAHADHCLDLDGGIRQTIWTVKAESYVVRFDLAGNPEAGPYVQQLRVAVDDREHLFTFDSTGKTTDNLGWVKQHLVFTANRDRTTLTFWNARPNAQSAGVALDHVLVRPLSLTVVERVGDNEARTAEFARLVELAIAMKPAAALDRPRHGDQSPIGMDLSKILKFTGQERDRAEFPSDHTRFQEGVNLLVNAKKTWALCSLLDFPNVDAKISAAVGLARLADPESVPVLLAAAKNNNYFVLGSENATLHAIYRAKLKTALEKCTGLSLTPGGQEARQPPLGEECDFGKVDEWLRARFLQAAPKVRILTGARTTFQGSPFVELSCQVTNSNKSPVMFVGYRPDSFDPPLKEGQLSPIYIVQLQRDGKWEEHGVGWCGTGIDGIEVPSGGTGKFALAVPVDPPWKAVRVGIRWSRPLEFSTAKPDAFAIAWSEELTLAEIDAAKEKEGTDKE